MFFDRNISENKYGKKSEGSYLSCVSIYELYFSKNASLMATIRTNFMKIMKILKTDGLLSLS